MLTVMEMYYTADCNFTLKEKCTTGCMSLNASNHSRIIVFYAKQLKVTITTPLIIWSFDSLVQHTTLKGVQWHMTLQIFLSSRNSYRRRSNVQWVTQSMNPSTHLSFLRLNVEPREGCRPGRNNKFDRFQWFSRTCWHLGRLLTIQPHKPEVRRGESFTGCEWLA